MLGLCKYKNMFGRPGKGIHRFRIANIPIVDVVATIVLAYVLRSVFFKKHNYWTVLAMCFFAATIIHQMFCVKTPVTRFLFS